MKNTELRYLFTDSFFKEIKYQKITGRYVTNFHLENFIKAFDGKLKFEKIGSSVQDRPIYKTRIGNGKIKILAWSQMHGNESTTTKAVFDLLNFCVSKKNEPVVGKILDNISLDIIPILNPDGAEAYTRVNANAVDLNRDLQNLTEPESRILKEQYEAVEPDFCLNLHDQRTIFSAGENPLPATLSFLTPSMDEERSIDDSRKKSMSLIAGMAMDLEEQLPGQIGRYDDAFNINCAGDSFQNLGCPTLLFEAGHYPGDYEREETRKFVFRALLSCLYQLTEAPVETDNYQKYFQIPENEKLFNDVVIRNAMLEGELRDVAIQFKEVLKNGRVEFEPVIEKIEPKISSFGHKEIRASEKELKLPEGRKLRENVIVNKIILNTAELQVKYR